MSTFLRATEIWIPTRDRRELELGDGSYDGLEAFRSSSERLRFGYAEGLPGRAWATRRPVVLPSLDHPCFRRAEAARTSGLGTAVAVPIFAGELLTAVLVLFSGSDPSLVGAIEVWQEEGADLALTEGFYGAATSFEKVSREAHFRPGHGLPGIVWATGMPKILPDLGRTSCFLRAEAAVRAGIELGVGIPCGGGDSPATVLTFLSGFDTPIAERFEIWLPNDDHTALAIHDATGDHEDAPRRRDRRVVRGEGAIGRTLLTGIPTIAKEAHGEPEASAPRTASLERARLVALPIFEEGALRAVVAIHL